MQKVALRGRVSQTDWRERYYDEATGNMKEDIRELKQDVKEIKQDLNAFKTEMRGEIRDLRGEIGDLRGEIADLRGEVGGLRGEFDKKIDGMFWKLLLGISAILGAFLGFTKYFSG